MTMNTLAKYFIKGELIEAMAQTYVDRIANCSMYVNPDINRIGNEYFKFCNNASWSKATKLCRISFNKPQYIVHTNSRKVDNWILTAKEKKYLVRTLLSTSKKYVGLTVWQSLIVDYNAERYSFDLQECKDITLAVQYGLVAKAKLTELERAMLHALPFDLPMPNYLNLR